MSEAEYEVYKAQRELRVRAETLAQFFGDVPAADMEARYREEKHASQ